MNRNDKALNYLRQRGIDVDEGLKFYTPFTRPALLDMVRTDCPEVKVTTRTTKVELAKILLIHLHRNVFTARQQRRLAKVA